MGVLLSQEIPRWIANDILQQDCSRLVGFQLPIMTGNEIANFPGLLLILCLVYVAVSNIHLHLSFSFF